MLKAVRPSPLQIVFGGCIFVSLVAGAWGFYMLTVSQKFVQKTLPEVMLKGRMSSVEDCVNVTMDWYENCEAMKSLCESSVSRMMGACLAAQDRSTDCRDFGESTKNTHFGFKECQERGVTRFTRKACANSYRAIDHHCTNLVAGKVK